MKRMPTRIITAPARAGMLSPATSGGYPVRSGISGMAKNDQIISRIPHITIIQPRFARTAFAR